MKRHTIKAICYDCNRMHKKGKEFTSITSTQQLSQHHVSYPDHLVEMIEVNDYDRKTGFLKKVEQKD